MPKWKKDAKEFTVGVNYSDGRGYQSSIPIPVIDKLGKPDTIKFVINDDTNTVELISGKTHVSRKGIRVNQNLVDKIFLIKGENIFNRGFRPALIGLADDVGIKAHAANLKDKKQIRVVASGSYSNIQTYHKNIRTKELQIFGEEVPKYSVTPLKNYDGPDIDWNGYNQQFMSAQLAKSVGFFTYLDKKMEAMHNDIKKQPENSHDRTKRPVK